jgi:Protein of unknown function (DUF1592)/Protein of unknown function (DUF1588)/Protein of unknown function (DUF1585)/Protein of unknown function (DUF1587)/Protein of unknown function (DUF1595)/Planctomycete cytochrome C
MSRYLIVVAMVPVLILSGIGRPVTPTAGSELEPAAKGGGFVADHCLSCHTGANAKGGLKLDELKADYGTPEAFDKWVKVFDRVHAGEMPPKKADQPEAKERDAYLAALKADLEKADAARTAKDGRGRVRRLNRTEFENALKDLLELPGLEVKDNLPEDGKHGGFDKAAPALDTSFVHVERYLAAVDQALNAALCPLPEKPKAQKFRYSPWKSHRQNGREADLWLHMTLNPEYRTSVGLVGTYLDPTLVPSKGYSIQDDEPKATAVGLFRHQDSDFRMDANFAPVLSGPYAMRVSGYSVRFEDGKIVPTKRHGALVWQRGSSGHVYGTVDMPPMKAEVREIKVWLDRGQGSHGRNDGITFNPESVEKLRRPLGTPADGVAIKWLEIEGPLHDQWPPKSHTALFGDLPVKLWTKELGVPLPKQQAWPPADHSSPFMKNGFGERGDTRPQVYVESKSPEADAERLLGKFLPRAFRRSVSKAEVGEYVAVVTARMKKGAAFQDAMLAAYRQILTAPEFLLRLEGQGKDREQFALASRLSFTLWNTTPDDALLTDAAAGKLTDPKTLAAHLDRLLADSRSDRFVADFLGQWLKLNEIDANTPDKQLYPEYRPWLSRAMLAEARAFFRELLTKDLSATHFVKSDFTFLNEPLAELYGIPDVRGWDTKRVPLKPEHHRGGFLTMAAVLKATANGTTTSPVKRGVFVMEQLLGIHPTPPPDDIGSIEPSTDGATTIREQLAKHSSVASCASCHVKMDPYGFALESFDVVGEHREKYRGRAAGFPPQFKKLVAGQQIDYHFGAKVDPSGVTPDGKAFADVGELRALLAADPAALARPFVAHLVAYGTGTEVGFADRAEVDRIVERAKASGYGVRTLLSETVRSPLFTKP